MKIKRMIDIFPDDAVRKDPHNTIPCRWKGNGFKVVGFIPRSNPNLLTTMVLVLFPDARKGQVYSTTWKYLYVLNQYSNWVDSLPMKEHLLALGHKRSIVNKMVAISDRVLKS